MSDTEFVEKGARLGARTLLGGLFITIAVPAFAYMFVAIIELKESNAILAHELPELTAAMKDFKNEIRGINNHMREHEKMIPTYREWKTAVDMNLNYLFEQCEENEQNIEECQQKMIKGF